MLAFVIVLQVVVALFLIGVVLLQPGNRGGASAALGGAGSDTVFGARGANTFLSKITFGAAVGFMVTNLALSYMTSSGAHSKVTDVLETQSKNAKEAVPAGAHDEVKPPAAEQPAANAPAEAAKPADPVEPAQPTEPVEQAKPAADGQ